MPCVAAATVRDRGMPHTSHASRKALAAPAIADRQGTTRKTASSSARTRGGRDATSAESRTLSPTGL